MKKLISIIIPAYNEEDCVDELATRLKALFVTESQYDFEAIIVENGSIDSTWEKLQKIANADSRFKILKLSRNFRMDGGLTAGLDYIKGDACVLMTADLQDPPELISEFLRKWEAGWENIYGIVTKRGGTGPIRTLNSKMFYFVADKLTDGRIPKNASEFTFNREEMKLFIESLSQTKFDIVTPLFKKEVNEYKKDRVNKAIERLTQEQKDNLGGVLYYKTPELCSRLETWFKENELIAYS